MPEHPLESDGKKTANSREKAEVLAATFARASQTASLPESLQAFRKSKEDNFSHPTPDNTSTTNQAIKMTELQKAVKQIKNPKKSHRYRFDFLSND